MTLLGFGSCTAGFEDANRPGNKLSSEELARDNYTTGSFIIQMQNEAFPEQENTYQMTEDLIGNYLGRYMTYANDGFSGKNFACFNAPNGWVAWPFKNSTPKVTSAFNDISRITGQEGLMYGLALILRAQSLLRLSDMYGPFPIGAEEDATAYSSQEKVYKQLIADLDKAIAIIQPQVAANPALVVSPEYDKVYNGKFANWLKFANSLKLRMAIRMRFVDESYAKKIAEEAVKGGVMTSNADNCVITYIPNGQYKTSVEWGDSRACADLESYMNSFGDPRISKYFKPTEYVGSRPVIGCRAGAKVTNKKLAMEKYSAANIEQNSGGVWMTAAEMTFCRAEGAMLKWDMDGDVEHLYNEAIRLSFEQWGATGAEEYIANNSNTQAYYYDAYGGYGESCAPVSSITIKWNNMAPDEEKLERLIVQKWIALFPDGQEGWNEIRRTGYPKVFPVAQSTSGYDIYVPNRIPFDEDEKINNKANYEEAVRLLGGNDNYKTRMWWQRNRNK